MVSVFINGLGRIGRMLLRQISLHYNQDIRIVGCNSQPNIDMLSYLLQHDSVHGNFPNPVTYGLDWIDMGNGRIPYSQQASIEDISIKGADIVLECTGKFLKKLQLQPYLQKGAKHVLISAPASDPDKTVVFGINESALTVQDHIISNASCTTNCLAPLLKSLMSTPITCGNMTTIHSYTLDQNLLDKSHKKDFRRARAAALNMVPTSTGATKALELVIPELKGKLTGMSIRVPTANVSLIDLTLFFQSPINLKDITQQLNSYAKQYPNVLAIQNIPLVSSDYNGNTHSCIVDLPTLSIHDSMLHVLAWYDNEVGFSMRMLDVTRYLGAL